MDDGLVRMKTFPDRMAASEAAATLMADALRQRLDRDAVGSIAVSGGSTPAACLQALAELPLDWQRVAVTLTDERLVAATDPRSNEKMVREQLLRNHAANARFSRLTEEQLPELPMPFAASLIGMGEDGHFASLFPDLPGLPELLDPDSPPAVKKVRSSASDVLRLTLNLSALLASDEIVLLAFGDAKRAIIEASVGHPVDALLTQTRTPVTVVWAPIQE